MDHIYHSRIYQEKQYIKITPKCHPISTIQVLQLSPLNLNRWSTSINKIQDHKQNLPNCEISSIKPLCPLTQNYSPNNPKVLYTIHAGNRRPKSYSSNYKTITLLYHYITPQATKVSLPQLPTSPLNLPSPSQVIRIINKSKALNLPATSTVCPMAGK